MTEIVQNEERKIWSILAILLTLATAVSRNLVDLLFVLSALIIIYHDFKSCKLRGLKQIFSNLKYASILIGVWTVANIAGYFCSSGVGPLQLKEILSLRWVLSFYVCIYLGMHMAFRESVFRKIAVAYCLILLVSTYLQYFVFAQFGRFQGLFENPNIAAFCIAMPLVFLFVWESVSYQETKKIDWTLSVCSLFLAILIFFTLGRGIWISVIFSFFVISLLLKIKRNLLVAIIASCFIGGLFAGNVFGLKDRVMYSFDTTENSSQGIRFLLWRSNWEILKDYPLFGVGYLENYRLEIPYFKKIGISSYVDETNQYSSHAHNDLLQVAVGGGVVAVISFCLLFGGAIKLSYGVFRRSRSQEIRMFALGGLAILIVFLGMGIFDSPFVIPFSRNSFLIFFGLCLGRMQRMSKGSI
ncbi:hypothetical protein DOM22_09295 [Bdellovibrio sp. ZAP7]|uniref:O-antigen ligase family protein n=1 Tax=Bdellovibrio sp. ZAP7 TaxID=2231053 RepID=UPI0011646241|nr:O-antigen ligase family protein [Bdellovibrio sp. ZAP7]QDK45333.1 hypothetical protein DOM22_09295 [Bdellovibrio sp. ZAP7]